MAIMAEVTQSETGGPPIVRTLKRKPGATWKQGAVLDVRCSDRARGSS